MTTESKETVDENTKRGASKREFIKTLAGLGLGAAMAQTLYSSLNPKQRAQLVAWAQSYGKPMTYAELGRLIDAAAWDDVVRAVRYQPASYIVYQAPDGSYQAKNGNTGQIEFSGTNAASVIQQALNALSPGRTWKERVVLKGAFRINSQISVPSFTILDLQNATLLAGSGIAGLYYFRLDNKTDVEIDGGFFAGDAQSPYNTTAYPEPIVASVPIGLYNCKRIKVRGIKTDHMWTSVNVYGGSSDIEVLEIYQFKNAAGIALVPDTADISDVMIRGCFYYDGFDDAFALLSEVVGDKNINNVTIANNHAFQPSTIGTTLNPSAVKIGATVGSISNINIVGNIFGNVRGYPIFVYGANASDVDVKCNQLIPPSLAPIYIKDNAKRVRVEENTIIGALTAVSGRIVLIDSCPNAGIDIKNNFIHGYGEPGFGLVDIYSSSGIDIINNRIKGLNISNVRAITLRGTSDYIRIENNRIIDINDPVIIEYVGSNNIIKGNIGYNPRGLNLPYPGQPAIPASGTAQSNTFPFPVIVYLYGGTVTQITINGQVVLSSGTGISLTGQSFTLNPGDTIAITYTAAPTWKWYGL